MIIVVRANEGYSENIDVAHAAIKAHGYSNFNVGLQTIANDNDKICKNYLSFRAFASVLISELLSLRDSHGNIGLVVALYADTEEKGLMLFDLHWKQACRLDVAEPEEGLVVSIDYDHEFCNLEECEMRDLGD